MPADDELDDGQIDDEQDRGQAPLDPNIRKRMREMEKQLKAGEDDRKELQALKRERAFDKAGIPEEGPGALLRRAYDGELDPEAIKAEAAKYGILQTASQDDFASQQMDQELSTFQRINNASSGMPQNRDTEIRDLNARLEAARSKDEVIALMTEAKAKGFTSS